MCVASMAEESDVCVCVRVFVSKFVIRLRATCEEVSVVSRDVEEQDVCNIL